MSELSPEARDLLDNHAHADEPTAQDRERMRARLALSLGAAALASTSAAGTSSVASAHSGAASASGASASAITVASGAKGGLFAGFGKMALALGLAGAIGAASFLGFRSEATHLELSKVPTPVPVPATVPPAQELPAPAVPPAAQLEATDTAESAPEARQDAAPRTSLRPASKNQMRAKEEDNLGAEIALLARAQAALREGAPVRALDLVREHAARFPRGTLSQERYGVEALARCGLHQDRSRVLEDFLREAPDSPLLARVRAACQEP